MRRIAQTLGSLVTLDRVFALAVACLVFHLGTKTPIADPDLGWHLRVGESVWRDGWPPLVDEFSHTIAGKPWIAYSWLFELVFWWLGAALGFHAVIVASAALVAATFVVVYRLCRAAGGAPIAAYAATTLALIATAPYVSQRPGNVSFLLVAVVLATLLRYRRGEPARLWPLVPLMALWANVHLFFVYALAWLWLAALWAWGETALRLASRPPRGWRPLGLIALLCTAAPVANPYGARLIANVADLASQPASLAVITEHTSPDFHGAAIIALPLLLATLAALAWSRERPDPFALVLVLLHLALALYMQRNLPYLGIVAAPVLARAATRAWPALRITVDARPLPPRHALAHIGLAVLFVALALSAAPTHAALERNLRADAFPVDAVSFLREQPPLGRMMNGYNWGGYLIQTLYPRYRVSIDSRSGAYGEAFTLEYLEAHFARPGWEAYLERMRPDFVLWERDAALALALARSPGWVEVYRDRIAVIFVRGDHPLRAALEQARPRTEA
jgi:hypothetical protein